VRRVTRGDCLDRHERAGDRETRHLHGGAGRMILATDGEPVELQGGFISPSKSIAPPLRGSPTRNTFIFTTSAIE